MSESLVIDWLNENSYRAYPLQTAGSYVLPENIVVDAQLTYTTIPTPVALTQIVSDSTNVTFHVSGGLTFVVAKSATFPYAIRLSSGSVLVAGEGTPNIVNGTYNYTTLIFEPSVVTEFSHEWLGVSSINFGSALTGVINFIEGYQFGININNPVITLSAGDLFGEPIGCTHFGANPEDCGDILSYINGVDASSAGVLRIIAGPGVVVLDDPPNHRIYVGLSFNPQDVCQPIPPNPQALNL